jgi:hypothetical protein
MNDYKEILSNPATGRKLMSDYGYMIDFIKRLLKETADREYKRGMEEGAKQMGVIYKRFSRKIENETHHEYTKGI